MCFTSDEIVLCSLKIEKTNVSNIKWELEEFTPIMQSVHYFQLKNVNEEWEKPEVSIETTGLKIEFLFRWNSVFLGRPINAPMLRV